MARFLSLMVILGMLICMFAGQSNAFSLSCYAMCVAACSKGGGGGIGAISSQDLLQPQEVAAEMSDDGTSNYDTDGLLSCGWKCIKLCRDNPGMPSPVLPPPEAPVAPVPPTPEAPQVPVPSPPTPVVAPVPPTPEAPQVPVPSPPSPAPEAPQPSSPSPSPSPSGPPCVAYAKEEVAGIVGKLNDFCKLGCATRLCTRLSTTQRLAPVEIRNCVDNCSEMCNKRY